MKNFDFLFEQKIHSFLNSNGSICIIFVYRMFLLVNFHEKENRQIVNHRTQKLKSLKVQHANLYTVIIFPIVIKVYCELNFTVQNIYKYMTLYDDPSQVESQVFCYFHYSSLCDIEFQKYNSQCSRTHLCSP